MSAARQQAHTFTRTDGTREHETAQKQKRHAGSETNQIAEELIRNPKIRRRTTHRFLRKGGEVGDERRKLVRAVAPLVRPQSRPLSGTHKEGTREQGSRLDMAAE